MKNIFNNIFLIFFIFFLSTVADAAPNIFNFQAKIKKPDGTNLEAADVSFRFKYINAAGTCTLYMEDFNNLSMTGTAGNISFALGNGAKVFPPTATNLAEMFSNNSLNTMSCFEGGNYTPTLSTEKRKLSVDFSYAGSGGLQTLNGIEINATPYAMYATDSEKLGGFAANLFTRLSDFTSCTGGQVLTYNGSIFSCVSPGSSTSFTGSLVGDVTGTQAATVVSTVAGKSAAQISTSVDDTINATSAATPSRIVKRDGFGSASFVTAQATNFSGRNLLLFEPTDNNKVTIRAPTTFTAGDYSLFLPQNAGAPGSVLSTDGTGVTSWIPAASGSVTNVTAGLPLLSSGGSTPNITMPAATGAVDGYLSAANFTIFNNKVSSPWLMNTTNTYFNTGNVGIGTTTPAASLQVGNGTPQVDTWWNNFGVLVVKQKMVPASDDDYANFLSDVVLDSTANTNEFNVGIQGSVSTQAGNVFNFGNTFGVRAGVVHRGSGVISALGGFAGGATNGSSGGVTNLLGAQFGIVNSGGGTVSNAYGLQINDLTNSSGTITNTYGIYIGTVVTGTQTNPAFSLYSSDSAAKSYFAGNVGIGTATPGSALDVKGTIRLSGATSGYVGFSPAAVAGSTTYTLPSADGSSGNFLTTNGSGVLTWTAQSSTSATDMIINGVTIGRGLASVSTNTALGASSLSANTTGANNTASGFHALKSVTTSSGNTATGSRALYSNSSGGSNNTATGAYAIYTNVGYENTANGYGALYSAVSTHRSTAIGAYSIYNSAPGTWSIVNNTAVGAYSLYGSLTLANNTGLENVAIGSYSLYSNSSGSYNSVNGMNGLYSNTSGSYNTAEGHSSMYSNTIGDYNTASGYQSLFANVVGQYNTAIGRGALYSNASNHGSTAIGYFSMYYAQPGTYSTTQNTAVGMNSLRGSTTAANNTGSANTALGHSALEANTSGSNTTAVGVFSGSLQTTGSNNTFLGYSSGSAVTTGSNNIILGSNTGSGIATANNNIIISDGAGNNRIQIDSSGNVGIDKTNPAYKLDVVGDINASGNVRASGVALTSDERLKTNIIPVQNSLKKILQIKGVNYYWKDKEKRGSNLQLGVIAQDVEKVFPESVLTDGEGSKSVLYTSLIGPIVESIKTLYKRLVGTEQQNMMQDRQIASMAESKADKKEVELLKIENAQLKIKSKEFDALKAYLCNKDPQAPMCH